MSQQRRPRGPGRSESPAHAPAANADTEKRVDPEPIDLDEQLARQPPVLAYSLVVAMIVMLLLCALAIYIAAP